MNAIQTCTINSITLSLDDTGEIWIKKSNQSWTALKFNETYRGCYPNCRFSQIAATDRGFVAAGWGEDGFPCVYRSLLGGVWEPVTLMMTDGARATGRIVKLLFDSRSRQIFLLCENGELVTLPDCPKCVLIQKITDKAIVDGCIDGRTIRVTVQSISGETEELLVSIDAVSQYRVTREFAAEQISQGGLLIDLRETEPDEVSRILKQCDKDRFLAFVCNTGTRASLLAKQARSLGCTRAYVVV